MRNEGKQGRKEWKKYNGEKERSYAEKEEVEKRSKRGESVIVTCQQIFFRYSSNFLHYSSLKFPTEGINQVRTHLYRTQVVTYTTPILTIFIFNISSIHHLKDQRENLLICLSPKIKNNSSLNSSNVNHRFRLLWICQLYFVKIKTLVRTIITISRNISTKLCEFS